uniref:AGC-kinase C-terminal domain-containing protein n=1 Tax=Craspedostauros australis TaxID=1486917 RepID=A0A7R9ZMN2_9STRA
MERNPRRRLGVTGIRTAMEHEFFRSISWRALYGRRVEAPIRPCEGWTPPDAASESGQDTASLQWHDKAVSHVGDLDAATANFDNTFTRMPVETDDKGRDAAEEAELEELHEDTFVGFTFDNKDSDAPAGKQSPKPAASNSKQTLQSKTSQGDIRTID